MPTFGSDTIRKFCNNVSELKKLAARDFEDLLQVSDSFNGQSRSILRDSIFRLQCSISAFDGLVPEPHNSSILKLLFICCNWHGLAKLRMHTDLTLDIFDSATTEIGSALRHFATSTCSAFTTKELRREVAARQCRAMKQNVGRSATNCMPTTEQSGARPKSFNVNTIKNHFLGDYANQIRRLGTTDSYSTEPVLSIFF